MSHVIVGLDPAQFAGIDTLSPSELEARGILRQTVGTGDSAPCRVSLEPAAAGETVYLLNFTHQPTPSPYGARGPIFVRAAALHQDGAIARSDTPPMLRDRVLSARTYDGHGHISDGRLVGPQELHPHLAAMFQRADTQEVHLHFPGYGCYAAKAVRA